MRITTYPILNINYVDFGMNIISYRDESFYYFAVISDIIDIMAFRIETRQEMLSGFRYAAIIKEQKQFGYFLGSWVFSDVDDATKAANTRQQILNTKNVKENEETRYVVEQVLTSLDDSAWRWFEYATKWTLHYTKQVAAEGLVPEEYKTRLNGLVENLITQVNQGSANHTRMQSPEQYSQWTPKQLEEWNKENNQGDRLQGSKFYKNNVIYTFPDGSTMVRLENEKDYEMVGEKLFNCVRHEQPNGWKNHPGMIALVDPEGNPKAVARFGGDGQRIISPGEPQYMKICYEFQSQEKGHPVIAYNYGEYLFEFLEKTTPEDLGFEGEAWENESKVQPPHEIVKRYKQGERDFQSMDLKGADLRGANLSRAVLRGANLQDAKLRGANLYRADLSDADLKGANAGGADMKRANLNGANLIGALLSRADLNSADLKGADLSGARLFKTDLYGADLYGANLSGADLTEADMNGADLSGSDLSGANLTGTDLRGAILRGANLSGAFLSRADLIDAILSGANLSLADLNHAILRGAILRGANLTGTDLYRADLYGANVTDANLKGANLNSAILTGANLSGVDLSGVDLRGAKLISANLSGSDLSGADLKGADLSGADLTGANLTGANLYHANLSDADLSGANLEGANMTGVIDNQSY